MLKKCILSIVFMVSLASFTHAQEMDFLIGAHAGFAQSLDGDGNFAWGGFLRHRSSDILGFEAMADVTEDDFLDDTTTSENVTVMGNILFYPIPDIFYLSVGAGWSRADIDYTSPVLVDETEDNFAWNAGVGIEIPVSSWLSVVVDGKYVFRDLEFSNNPAADDVDTDFWMVRGGLAFHFGNNNY